jgi:hypothetical protein
VSSGFSKNTVFRSLVHMPVILAIQEAEAGRSLGPGIEAIWATKSISKKKKIEGGAGDVARRACLAHTRAWV